MKPAVWRALALTFLALGVAFVCYQVTLPEIPDYGIHANVDAKHPGMVRVDSVSSGSTAARAHINTGDRIVFGNTQMERARVLYAYPGQPVSILVNDRRVTLIASAKYADSALLIPLAVRLAFLFVAALLVWRRCDDTVSRSLVAFLFCYAMAIGMRNNVLPSPALTLLIGAIGASVALLLGSGFAAIFAATFPSGVAKPLPLVLSRIAMTIAIAASAALLSSVWIATSAAQTSWLNYAVLWTIAVIAILVVATLVIAYIQGAPEERQRRRWVFMMLGLGLAGVGFDLGFLAAAGYNPIVDIVTLFCVGSIPFGLAYVILRHRVIDVGFVLNRAVVYGGVSVIIVGVFLIVETLMAKYVEQHNHIESLAVQLTVALILGFSVRFIHTRVDRFVDTVFFRERHEAEAAMREFAFDAPYITEAGVLLRRCLEVVRKHAHASNAGVWLREGTSYSQADGTFPNDTVDENDPAIVAMRARRVVAELHDLRSSLPGALAFPMIVRGELTGMLLCGPKTEDETYAPDERDTLSAVATAVAHALDGLRIAELEQTVERLLAGRPGGATQGAMGTF